LIANRAGKYDVAIQHLTQVVKQFPQHTQAQFQLATAYQRSGNAEKAKEHFDVYKQLTAAESTATPGGRP
jgi:DNA-binding SARP family transcriptional activator